MNPNKIYNRILDLIGFLLTVLLIVGNVLGWFRVSWWWLVFTIFAPSCFHATEYHDEDDD